MRRIRIYESGLERRARLVPVETRNGRGRATDWLQKAAVPTNAGARYLLRSQRCALFARVSSCGQHLHVRGKSWRGSRRGVVRAPGYHPPPSRHGAPAERYVRGGRDAHGGRPHARQVTDRAAAHGVSRSTATGGAGRLGRCGHCAHGGGTRSIAPPPITRHCSPFTAAAHSGPLTFISRSCRSCTTPPSSTRRAS